MVMLLEYLSSHVRTGNITVVGGFEYYLPL